MQITISYLSGFNVDGVVLSVNGARLRVAIRDWDDAAEFRRCDGLWVSENGDSVEIDWLEPFEKSITTGKLFDRANQWAPVSVWVN
jgi:hypothetical protein